jgi:hypothetical protein
MLASHVANLVSAARARSVGLRRARAQPLHLGGHLGQPSLQLVPLRRFGLRPQLCLDPPFFFLLPLASLLFLGQERLSPWALTVNICALHV